MPGRGIDARDSRVPAAASFCPGKDARFRLSGVHREVAGRGRYKAARNRPLTRGQKLSNTALAAVRAPVEHGFAHLKNWRVLGKVRTDPAWATALVRALLVLTNREVAQ
ncbi:transposase family protein [Streptomyces decoyicus]|uniref:transposase family protein n=1 Tax=Streptomyces decoyicus TaxID=249567 RepID=UPI0033DF3FE9